MDVHQYGLYTYLSNTLRDHLPEGSAPFITMFLMTMLPVIINLFKDGLGVINLEQSQISSI